MGETERSVAAVVGRTIESEEPVLGLDAQRYCSCAAARAHKQRARATKEYSPRYVVPFVLSVGGEVGVVGTGDQLAMMREITNVFE